MLVFIMLNDEPSILLAYRREHKLLEETNPSFLLQVKDNHIIKLLADIENASEYDHIMFEKGCAVA
jgi:hypothetical protein